MIMLTDLKGRWQNCKGMALYCQTRYWLYIDAAKLSEKEMQIVLTEVNYEEESEMYEQSERALRKLFGEQIMSHESTMREDVK